MALVQIEPIGWADVDAVVDAHIAAFPTFFLTTMGRGFLRTFYRAFVGEPSAVALKAFDHSHEFLGFVVGTVEPAGFFKRLLKRRWWAFAGYSALATLRTPRYAARLLRAVAYRGGPVRPAGYALLSSLAVLPIAQGRGVGKKLVAAWTAHVSDLKRPGMYLTTDAENNEATNKFYQGIGLIPSATYRTKEGRRMNVYTKSLTA